MPALATLVGFILLLDFLNGQMKVAMFVLDDFVGACGNNAVCAVFANCHDQLGIENVVCVVLIVVVGDEVVLGILKCDQRIKFHVVAFEPDEDLVSFHQLERVGLVGIT